MQKTLERARMLMRTKVSMHVETVVLMSAASRRSHNKKSEWEKYGEYFMNRSVSDIMSKYSEQHDEWH